MGDECKCGLALWKHEVEFRVATEYIDKEDKEMATAFIENMGSALEETEKSCGVNPTSEKAKIKDAKFNVDNKRWMDAKWDLLSASGNALDVIKRCAGVEN